MNLEDYAYNEDGRWYVNPQVSLDEQNAFINNYRNLQAQNNSQIEQQTKALGTQVPSQLGGLIGGGSYFKSRYQTPQTNQTIAELRAVAQQQALSQALNNELAKAKKKYKDAQNNASLSGAKGGLNDVTLEVQDSGTDAPKYQTEYVSTDTSGGDLASIRANYFDTPEKIESLKKELETQGFNITNGPLLRQQLLNKDFNGSRLTELETAFILEKLGLDGGY